MRPWKRFVVCCAVAIVGSAPAHGAGLAPLAEGGDEGVEWLSDELGVPSLSARGIWNESMNALFAGRSAGLPHGAANLPDNTPISRGRELGPTVRNGAPLCSGRC